MKQHKERTMNQLLENMVLSPLLEKQLTALVEHPKKFPEFLVFHGEPGTGKTTFARQFAQLNALHETYIPVNEIKLNQVWEKDIEASLRTKPISFDDAEREKPFDRIFVIDEFHNISANQQDRFKTVYDRLDDRTMFIFVLNTDARKPSEVLSRKLSGAMYSRCFEFNFDIPKIQCAQLVPKAEKIFPNLSSERIKALMPDFRKMTQENEVAGLLL